MKTLTKLLYITAIIFAGVYFYHFGKKVATNKYKPKLDSLQQFKDSVDMNRDYEYFMNHSRIRP